MDLDTEQRLARLLTVVDELGLMKLPVCCDGLDGLVQYWEFRGLVVDEHDDIWAVVASGNTVPFCRLIHWSRVHELRNRFKDPA
jgi:hypothetical protein